MMHGHKNIKVLIRLNSAAVYPTMTWVTSLNLRSRLIFTSRRTLSMYINNGGKNVAQKVAYFKH